MAELDGPDCQQRRDGPGRGLGPADDIGRRQEGGQAEGATVAEAGDDQAVAAFGPRERRTTEHGERVGLAVHAIVTAVLEEARAEAVFD